MITLDQIMLPSKMWFDSEMMQYETPLAVIDKGVLKKATFAKTQGLYALKVGGVYLHSGRALDRGLNTRLREHFITLRALDIPEVSPDRVTVLCLSLQGLTEEHEKYIIALTNPILSPILSWGKGRAKDVTPDVQADARDILVKYGVIR